VTVGELRVYFDGREPEAGDVPRNVEKGGAALLALSL